MKNKPHLRKVKNEYSLEDLDILITSVEWVQEPLKKKGVNSLGFTKEDIHELLKLWTSLCEKMKTSLHYQFFRNRLKFFEKWILEIKLLDLKKFWSKEILDEINRFIQENPIYKEEWDLFFKKIETINGEIPQRSDMKPYYLSVKTVDQETRQHSTWWRNVRNSDYKPKSINRRSSLGMTG